MHGSALQRVPDANAACNRQIPIQCVLAQAVSHDAAYALLPETGWCVLLSRRWHGAVHDRNRFLQDVSCWGCANCWRGPLPCTYGATLAAASASACYSSSSSSAVAVVMHLLKPAVIVAEQHCSTAINTSFSLRQQLYCKISIAPKRHPWRGFCLS